MNRFTPVYGRKAIRQLLSADLQLSAFVLPCWPALSPSPCSWVTWLVLGGPWQFKHFRHWCHPFHHILTTRIMWTEVWFFLILLRCRVPLAATPIVLPMGLFLSSNWVLHILLVQITTTTGSTIIPPLFGVSLRLATAGAVSTSLKAPSSACGFTIRTLLWVRLMEVGPK